MSNPYKQACDKIAVPPGLIAKTSYNLRRARSKPRGKATRYVWYGSLAAACIAVAILIPVLMWTITSEPGIFITKLEAGVHTEYVELADGHLSFQRESGGLIVVPPLLMSGPNIRKEEWARERYMAYLDAEVSPGYLPRGMALAEEFSVVYVSSNGSILRDSYTMRFTSGSGAVEISASKGKLPPNCDLGRDENSRINGHPLAVGILDDGAYWAQFVVKGVGFYIEASDISQSEFIKILYYYFW